MKGSNPTGRRRRACREIQKWSPRELRHVVRFVKKHREEKVSWKDMCQLWCLEYGPERPIESLRGKYYFLKALEDPSSQNNSDVQGNTDAIDDSHVQDNTDATDGSHVQGNSDAIDDSHVQDNTDGTNGSHVQGNTDAIDDSDNRERSLYLMDQLAKMVEMSHTRRQAMLTIS